MRARAVAAGRAIAVSARAGRVEHSRPCRPSCPPALVPSCPRALPNFPAHLSDKGRAGLASVERPGFVRSLACRSRLGIVNALRVRCWWVPRATVDGERPSIRAIATPVLPRSVSAMIKPRSSADWCVYVRAMPEPYGLGVALGI